MCLEKKLQKVIEICSPFKKKNSSGSYHAREKVTSGYKLSVERNFAFAFLSLRKTCDWLEKLAPLSQPMRCKASLDLLSHIFPQSAPVRLHVLMFQILIAFG